MIQFHTTESLQGLRRLADQLDIRLGVTNRKWVLEGNERLTLSTDAATWTKWLHEVHKRLVQVGDTKLDGEVVAQITRLRGIAGVGTPEQN